MSTSNESDPVEAEKVTLDVNTGGDSAEIFVIDGQFNLVGRGIGPHQAFALAPGIYKIKVVAGAKTHEEHVVLRPGSKSVRKEFSPLPFSTPAPLDDTDKTHAFHVKAAVQHSRLVHVQAGVGSWIFVCARGWSEKTRTDSATHARPHPARGLKLLNDSGETVVDFEQKAAKNLGWEPWAACNVSVRPGIYRLQLKVPSLGRTLEQTVVASPYWQTQIFLLQRDYGQDTHEAARRGVSDIRADLSGASVLMNGPGYIDHLPQPPRSPRLSSPPGFDSGKRVLRQVELARLALLNQRKILSDELRSMLRYKSENPMLGIFGAHLILLERKSRKEKPDKKRLEKEKADDELLREVVKNLRRLVGREHPDVEAIAAFIETPTKYSFNTPPMLQRSWSLICEATADNPELVPENSLLSEVAQSWWCNSFWLTWLTPEAGEGSESAEYPDELSDLEEAVMLQLKATRRRRRGDSPPASVAYDLNASPSEAGSVSRGASADQDLASDVELAYLNTEEIKKLTRQLGVPRAVVKKSLDVLRRKIADKKS